MHDVNSPANGICIFVLLCAEVARCVPFFLNKKQIPHRKGCATGSRYRVPYVSTVTVTASQSGTGTGHSVTGIWNGQMHWSRAGFSAASGTCAAGA
jgi:hypothetical protein